MACSAAAAFAGPLRREFACVGAPPEKEVFPEPRENGALLAALGRLLRRAGRNPA